MSLPDWNTSAERDLIAQKALRNFWFFALNVFGIHNNPLGRKWLDPQVHLPLAEWFQTEIEDWLRARARGLRERRYLAILVPRAVGKSTLITQAGMLWTHLQDPNLSVYIGNEKRENSVDFLSSIKEQLEGADRYSQFTHLFGNWKTDNKRWRQDSFVHAARDSSRKDVSFGVWGIESGLTSKHPDVLVLDDLVSYESVKQDGGWYDLIYSHMAALIPVVEVDGLVILIGTRYSDADPFGRSFESDGIYSVDGYPSPIYQPNGGLWRVYFVPGAVKDSEGNEVATCPKTWPLPEIKRFYARDPLKCAAQVYNDPKATPHRPLTEAQFDSLCRAPESVPKKARITLHLDTAFKDLSRQSTRDRNVILVAAHDPEPTGRVWILEVLTSPLWRAEDFQRELTSTIKRYQKTGHRVAAILDETPLGGAAAAWPVLLRSWIADAQIKPVPDVFFATLLTKQRKTARHFEALGFVTAGNVFFVKDAPGMHLLREELCNVGMTAHDDCADAFSLVFHPEVFRILRSLPPERVEAFQRPWDEVLSGKRDIWQQHDTIRERFDEAVRPPL